MTQTAKLTLGPLFYHWPAEKIRDFYFRIADEAPVDVVYLGEVVCSKREPFFAPHRAEVIERLQKAGKEIVLSSLALMTLPREIEALKEACSSGLLIEANEVGAIQILQAEKKNAPFIVGPFINVLSEGTFDYLAAQGATRIVFASETNGQAIAKMAGRRPDIEKEAQVFGRQPLAVSMRCYSARAYGRDKDHCRYACGDDQAGLEAQTLDGQGILTINGTQTLTRGTLVLAEEMLQMRTHGVTHFRLSPEDMDMVALARLYRDVLEGRIDPDSLFNQLKQLDNSILPLNGFYHGREGLAYVAMQK